MGEPANKLRAEIDLGEFERRLRAPSSSPASYEDPLAELARLVDGKTASSGNDPFRELFAAPRPVPASRAPAVVPALGREHAFPGDLRGTIDPNHAADFPPDVIPSHSPPVAAAPTAVDASEYGDPAEWAEHEAAYAAQAQPVPRRSRRPLYAMGAIVCAGLVGIGASFAMRSKAPASQELAMVKAPAGPVKVQPQNPGGVDVPNQSASILDRSAGAQVTKVVSREEQPVDLDQTVKQMRVVTLGGLKDGSVSTLAGQGAASVPVPPPPASASVTATNTGFPEPKRVKTVQVRPDGSLIGADASSGRTGAIPTPASRPSATGAVADAGALPKSSTPKSTVRVATTPKVEVPAAPVAGDQPVGTTPAGAKPKVAAAAPKPVKVASAEAGNDTAPITTASTGGFSVQLAAPASEQEARTVSARLAQKFSEPLGGRHPAIVKADLGEKSIYRVRVSTPSREEAISLCEKVKAKGGACFVAKN
jgi:hypothetical protein